MKPIHALSALLFAGGLCAGPAAARDDARAGAPPSGDRTRLRAEVVYTDMSAGIIRVRDVTVGAEAKHDERGGAAEQTPSRLRMSDVTLKVDDKIVGRMESLRNGEQVELTCRPGPSAAVDDPATLLGETLPNDLCAVVVGISK